MNNYLKLLRRKAKQLARFNILKTLVHHCSRVYRNLTAHRPNRVGTSLRRCYLRKFAQRRAQEWATGGSQHQFVDVAKLLIADARRNSGETLKNRVVLTVHRQQRCAGFARGGQQQLARHNQRFLVSQKQLFSRTGSGERRIQPGGPNDCGHHNIHVRRRRNLRKSLLANQHLSSTALLRQGCA